MAEPFDPSMIQDLAPATDGSDAPTSIGEALGLTRQAFSGMDDLPIDSVALEEGEGTALALDAPTPPTAVPLPIDPAVLTEPLPPLSVPSPEMAALQQRLALMEAELAASRTPLPPAEPPRLSEDVTARITSRFQQAFAGMTEMAEGETDAQFEARRARAFAETIVQAVYEDLLPTEAAQARFRPMAEQIAEQQARQVFDSSRQQVAAQDQQAGLIHDAVAAARQAGYDAYDPNDARHAASRDSRLVWGVATQVDPNLPAAQQIQELLSLLPTRQATTPVPDAHQAPARPQPMARQGNLPAPAAAEDDAGPMSLNEMMRVHAQQRRIGMG